MGRIPSFKVRLFNTAKENSATNAWNLNLSNGNMNRNTKATNSNNVRPVSASIINMEKEDIFEAYFNCRTGKRRTASALDYEVNYETRLLDLLDRINKRVYYPAKSICFVVTRPRYREVFAASFEDRIVQHYVALRLEPMFERIFSNRTFSCRKGKGQLYGINMLYNDIKDCSVNYTEDCYIMKLDLKGFFMSINKRMAHDMVDKFILDNYKGSDLDDLRYVCKIITLHEPEKDCEIRSPESFWGHLPKNKSLFTNGGGLGLAIGNIFAQHFANFLLNNLDWYIEALGIEYHGRYVDDIYMIHKSKEKLLSCVQPIRELLSTYGLMLNEKKFYLQHYTKGLQFTGGIVKPNRVYCGPRIINNFKQAVKRLNLSTGINDIKKSVLSINSYLGLLRQHNEYDNRKKILGMIDKSLFKYVYIKGHHEVIVVKKEYR